MDKKLPRREPDPNQAAKRALDTMLARLPEKQEQPVKPRPLKVVPRPKA